MQTRIQPWDIRDGADLLGAGVIGSRGRAQEIRDALSRLYRDMALSSVAQNTESPAKIMKQHKTALKKKAVFLLFKKKPPKTQNMSF